MGIRREKWEKFLTTLQKCERVLVAFSGGADSTLVLAAARKIMRREDVLAVTAVSASLPLKERKATHALAALLGAEHLELETQELSNPSYASNPSNRCYFCKDELYGKLAPLASARGMVMVDGFNVSDRSDYRPGFQASQKWNVQHPLDDSALGKGDIRVLSRWLKLPTWNKPASPCLSSRIPYGTPVTVERLRMIEKAEEAVKSHGFSVVRVRHFETEAHVEVPLEDIPRLLQKNIWPDVEQKILSCGYEKVWADPRGFKSGRLNSPTENLAAKLAKKN